MNYIDVKNLNLIFGKGKDLVKAKEMFKNGKSNEEIREVTCCAVGVRDITFDIQKGETFVIVGLSGSGKSSLIRCFNKLNNPTGSSIIIDGLDVNSLEGDELLEFRRNKISMVFQSFGLLSHRCVQKNVEYGLEIKGVSEEEREVKALEAIEIVGLKGWEDYYPHQLSGGMKQRVGLARALANDPDILLMDEPYSALDPLIRREMQNELISLEDYMEKTIVFITHDMNEAFRLGDRIMLMKDGEVVQLGKPSAFFNAPANEYVEDFIQDVDKTQVLRAKQIMEPITKFIVSNSDRLEVIEILKEAEKDFLYVTDIDKKYLGYVTLESLLASDEKTIETLIETDQEPYPRNKFIKELVSLLDESSYDIPIVKRNNVLVGVVSPESLVAAIK